MRVRENNDNDAPQSANVSFLCWVSQAARAWLAGPHPNGDEMAFVRRVWLRACVAFVTGLTSGQGQGNRRPGSQNMRQERLRRTRPGGLHVVSSSRSVHCWTRTHQIPANGHLWPQGCRWPTCTLVGCQAHGRGKGSIGSKRPTTRR